MVNNNVNWLKKLNILVIKKMFYFVNYLCINLMVYIIKSYIYDNYYK